MPKKKATEHKIEMFLCIKSTLSLHEVEDELHDAICDLHDPELDFDVEFIMSKPAKDDEVLDELIKKG